VTWEHEDGVLYWNVARTCSASDVGAGATVIRVTEARMVDVRRALNESCSYRVAACDLDGCSALSAPVAAVVGGLPSAPPVVAAWPSQNEVLSVRYLPPADAGGGAARAGGHQVLITNYRVELARDAAFSAIEHTTETHDGGVFLQHIRAKKGRRYWVRVTAANAEGWGTPGIFAGGSVRCLSAPGPPSDLDMVVAGHLALRVDWRPPLGVRACVRACERAGCARARARARVRAHMRCVCQHAGAFAVHASDCAVGVCAALAQTLAPGTRPSRCSSTWSRWPRPDAASSHSPPRGAWRATAPRSFSTASRARGSQCALPPSMLWAWGPSTLSAPQPRRRLPGARGCRGGGGGGKGGGWEWEARRPRGGREGGLLSLPPLGLSYP